MNISNSLKNVETSEDSQRAGNVNFLQRSDNLRIKRSLEDLNLIDAFIFSVSTEKIQDAEVIARIIIERAIGQKPGKVIVQTEKTVQGIDTTYHGVRLDLFVTEFDNEKIVKVYDIEPNNYNLDKLPKRERYNQSLTDIKLLEAGADYESLPDYISIWILPEDPFGDGRMIYTVKNMVAENEKIVYNDGVKRLFLNAKGTVGGNEKLGALLNYFCDSRKENATDPELLELHNIVHGVKESKKVGERYMSYITFQELAKYEARRWAKTEAIDEIRQEAEEEIRAELAQEVRAEVAQEVRAEVIEAGITSLLKTCVKLGVAKENMVELLMEEYLLTEEQAWQRVSDV